jgi:DNA-binding MarR family transcriptional regulator
MKGIERISAIDISAPRLEQRIPEVPIQLMILLRTMRAANHSLTTYLDLLLRPLGFTEGELHTLFILFSTDGGAAAPGMLCELLGQTKANMTRILSGLTGKHYVTRHDDLEDGRRQLIRITGQGKRFVQSLIPKVANPIVKTFEEMTGEEIGSLNGLLRRFVSSLDFGERQIRAST